LELNIQNRYICCLGDKSAKGDLFFKSESSSVVPTKQKSPILCFVEDPRNSYKIEDFENFGSRARRMEFFTYILKSIGSGQFYVGHCEDLEKRLAKHNKGDVKSTKGKGPWELAYKEIFSSRSDAYLREQFIKRKKSRKFIESLFQKRE